MKFLVAAALLALVAVARGSNEDGLSEVPLDDYSEAINLLPSDEAETKNLAPEHLIFSDFCIQSRDEIVSFLKESTNGAASNVFTIFFASAQEMASELITAQRAAVDQSSELIKQRVASQTGLASSKAEVDSNIEQAIENISLGSVMSNAVKAVLEAVIETARSELFTRIAYLRQKFSGDTLKMTIESACNSISYDLSRRLEMKLAQAKSAMKAAASSSPSPATMLDVINRARVNNIGCLTTGRFTKVAGFCDILRIASSSIYPLLGL